jgi:glucosamine--fructose-6-phosphate aminotransferase (isomerizing)
VDVDEWMFSRACAEGGKTMNTAFMEEREYASCAMYQAIYSQPREVRMVFSKNMELSQSLSERIGASESTTFFGIGSSLHAAQLGVALWRECMPAINVSSEHAFDFAHGLGSVTAEKVSPDPSQHLVVGFSHRGMKRYSRESLRRAQSLGVGTCFVTGEGIELGRDDADMHLTTVPQERSSAHTASVMGSFAVCAAVVEALHKGPGAGMLDALVMAVEAGLDLEGDIVEAARAVSPETRHIWLVGSGSDAVVAREIALKIKETSFLPSEGMSIEEFLHGPFQCVEPSDLLVVIDTQGYSTERASVLLKMAACVGLSTIAMSPELRSDEDLPRVRALVSKRSQVRTLNSITALVALQLFTCHLALMRGHNPDGFRLEEPRFEKASRLVTL